LASGVWFKPSFAAISNPFNWVKSVGFFRSIFDWKLLHDPSWGASVSVVSLCPDRIVPVSPEIRCSSFSSRTKGFARNDRCVMRHFHVWQ
jgi:hypothetical protein